MMNTDNRLLTRESSEHIREFFSTVERLSVSMERVRAAGLDIKDVLSDIVENQF